MRIRVALALSLIAPSALAWICAGWAPQVPSGWFAAGAAAIGLSWLLCLRRGLVLLLVATGLAALGAQTAAEARTMFDVSSGSVNGAFPFFDLRDGTLPDPAPPYVRVSGFVRAGWTLDEYAVGQGELPDQSSEPVAVLVPMLGSPPSEAVNDAPTGTPIRPGEAVIVVRIAPGQSFERTSPTVLQGKVLPLETELLTTLVQVRGDAQTLRGVLVDTLAVPSPRDMWLEVGLAALAALIAATCAFAASAPTTDDA